MAVFIVFALVLGLACYLVFTQGFFSSIIMAMLCMMSALVAFNYFELLAGLLNSRGFAAYGTKGGSLVAIFLVTLLILRLLTDHFIKGNMNFSMLIDRIGASFFGLLSSLTMVGIIALGFQMMPIPSQIMGFDRYPDMEKLEEAKNFFPSADGFVLSLVKQSSNYGFGGSTNFCHFHPDMRRELYMNRLTLAQGSRQEASPDAIRLVKAWMIEDGLKDLSSGTTLNPEVDGQFIAARVQISAGSEAKPGAQDADGKIRFALGNFRLVGFDPEERRKPGTSIYPIGFLLPDWKVADSVGLGEGKMLPGTREVDLLFEWPGDMQEIAPNYIEFKRTAWAKFTSAKMLAEAEPPVDSRYAAVNTAGEGEILKPKDSSIVYDFEKLTVITKENKKLLEKLGVPGEDVIAKAKEKEKEKEEKGDYVELEALKLDGKLVESGHILVKLEGNTDDKSARGVAVPKDYTAVLLEVDAKEYKSGSNFEVPKLVDSQLKTYPHAGMIAVGKIGTTKAIEFGYVTAAKKLAAKNFVGFPEKLELIKKNGSMEKVKIIYLIKTPTEDSLGLIGCEVGSSGILRFADGLDVVLVPGAK